MLVGQLDIWTFGSKTQASEEPPSFYLVFKKKSKINFLNSRNRVFSLPLLIINILRRLHCVNGLTSFFRRNVFHAQLVDCGPGKTAHALMVCLTVKRRDLCSFLTCLSLSLLRNDSRVGRKVVKGVYEVQLTGCGHMLVDQLDIWDIWSTNTGQ